MQPQEATAKSGLKDVVDEVHRLVEGSVVGKFGDPDTRALCSICGPVRVKWKAKGGGRPHAPLCRVGFNDQRRRRGWGGGDGREPHGLRLSEARAFRQGKACAICGASEGRLVVDHCHRTLRIRGVLCSKCNLGLHFIEREDWVSAARAYLKNADAPEIRVHVAPTATG